jgi:enoyl-CoA hydratase/carnithine racemase
MLQIIEHGPVREISLSRPPANALNGPLIAALDDALSKAACEAGAVVLSGLPGMFSAGLDVPGLIDLDRTEFTKLWHLFIGVQKTIAMMPVPTVFAMTGHAPAGGIVLGVFGDYRIMPAGPYKTGLNEVRVGLVVPRPPFEALVQLVGPATAEELISDGNMLTSEQALEIGLINELAESPAAVVQRAVEWCEQRLALPLEAMLATRRMARRRLHRIFENYEAEKDELFIDIWFSAETQERLRGLVASLAKKT